MFSHASDLTRTLYSSRVQLRFVSQCSGRPTVPVSAGCEGGHVAFIVVHRSEFVYNTDPGLGLVW